MGRKKKIVEDIVTEEVAVEETTEQKTKKELLALYDKLKELRITRISDLENLISRL